MTIEETKRNRSKSTTSALATWLLFAAVFAAVQLVSYSLRPCWN